jgi:hypothetical protein
MSVNLSFNTDQLSSDYGWFKHYMTRYLELVEDNGDSKDIIALDLLHTSAFTHVKNYVDNFEQSESHE